MLHIDHVHQNMSTILSNLGDTLGDNHKDLMGLNDDLFELSHQTWDFPLKDDLIGISQGFDSYLEQLLDGEISYEFFKGATNVLSAELAVLANS